MEGRRSQTLESTPPSELADNGARPGDRGRSIALEQLTVNQIARWFFTSSRTASNRLAVLLQLHYLKTIDIPWRASALVTATAKGARARVSVHTNAVIYCRVSTRQQAEDGSSLDSQEVAPRRLAASQGFTITQVFKEDFPGTELARPMLDQLRSGVKSGTYAAVFCYATDRVSRACTWRSSPRNARSAR